MADQFVPGGGGGEIDWSSVETGNAIITATATGGEGFYVEATDGNTWSWLRLEADGDAELGADDVLNLIGAEIQINGVAYDFPTNGKGFVNHGATAGTARPAGFASIEWFGSVEPTNAVDGDTWIDSSA